MCARLGPRVLVETMLGPGVEMLLGAVDDIDHGAVVTIAVGGIHAELLDDAVALPAPFTAEEAGRALEGLRLRALLDGARGAPPSDVDALCQAAARFSALAAALAGSFAGIDVNPLLVHAHGCTAADALLIGRDASCVAVATGVAATPD